MFTRLMRHYKDRIRTSPNEAEYVRGLQAHRFLMSGTSALPRPLRQKWYALSGGKRILERYGASEFRSRIVTPLWHSENIPDVSFGISTPSIIRTDFLKGFVGVALPGCDVHLANGNESELLVKTPGMFLRYHGDPDATSAAFDENGYFKTVDIGQQQGPYFFISGRASTDSKFLILPLMRLI
jgi:malonyl-CoA/methylmalonyl-CoA synthetase